MPFERFLLLWDELDDVVGAFRHHTLNLVHGAAGAGRSAAGRLAGLVITRPPLSDATPEA
jgi:hypothetical protein